MKRITALILTCCLLAALTACGSGELYIHDAPETPAPAPVSEPTAAVTEPDPQVAELLGEPVILNIRNVTENFPAPDGSERVILTYGYDHVEVYLESAPDAAGAINQVLATQDEIYYSGSGNGDGVNAYLELATDNFALSLEHETGINPEFSCMRSALIDRADSRVISLRYRTNSYTGGAHGLYTDRVSVFDTASGRQLSFDDLSADRSALEELLLKNMDEKLHNDVRYLPILDYMTTFNPDLDLEETLRALFRDGSWSLDSEGLTVFSDVYELGSYADGIVRFTVPYAELKGVLNEAWMPFPQPADGSLRIMDLNDRDGSTVQLVDKVTIADKGAQFRIFAEGTVYDVSLDSVTYISDDVGFYRTETHWYCSYLSNVGVQVQTHIPAGMPDLMVAYRDVNGERHNYLVTQSGEDGTVLLLEEEHVSAVG